MGEISASSQAPYEWPTLNSASYDLTRARIDAALGHHDQAMGRANALRTYFEERGAKTLVLEAEYALLEIDHQRTGQFDTSRAGVLVRSARAAGQDLIALRVEALGQG